MRKVEVGNISSSLASKRSSTSQSFARSGEDMVLERCTECGAVVEEYNDEDIGLCIVILSTFVHREPAMAAPLLPKMLRIVARYIIFLFIFLYSLINLIDNFFS